MKNVLVITGFKKVSFLILKTFVGFHVEGRGKKRLTDFREYDHALLEQHPGVRLPVALREAPGSEHDDGGQHRRHQHHTLEEHPGGQQLHLRRGE